MDNRRKHLRYPPPPQPCPPPQHILSKKRRRRKRNHMFCCVPIDSIHFHGNHLCPPPPPLSLLSPPFPPPPPPPHLPSPPSLRTWLEEKKGHTHTQRWNLQRNPLRVPFHLSLLFQRFTTPLFFPPPLPSHTPPFPLLSLSPPPLSPTKRSELKGTIGPRRHHTSVHTHTQTPPHPRTSPSHAHTKTSTLSRHTKVVGKEGTSGYLTPIIYIKKKEKVMEEIRYKKKKKKIRHRRTTAANISESVLWNAKKNKPKEKPIKNIRVQKKRETALLPDSVSVFRSLVKISTHASLPGPQNRGQNNGPQGNHLQMDCEGVRLHHGRGPGKGRVCSPGIALR